MTYHYRMLATNATGTTYGPDNTFTALGPLIKSTSAPTEIGQSNANVTGTLNPEGVETYYYYQYGTSAEYGQSTPTASVGAGTAPVAAPATLVPLTPGVSYHYRLVAWNEGGTSYGQDQTFTTEAGLAPLVSTGFTERNLRQRRDDFRDDRPGRQRNELSLRIRHEHRIRHAGVRDRAARAGRTDRHAEPTGPGSRHDLPLPTRRE